MIAAGALLMTGTVGVARSGLFRSQARPAG